MNPHMSPSCSHLAQLCPGPGTLPVSLERKSDQQRWVIEPCLSPQGLEKALNVRTQVYDSRRSEHKRGCEQSITHYHVWIVRVRHLIRFNFTSIDLVSHGRMLGSTDSTIVTLFLSILHRVRMVPEWKPVILSFP